MLVLSPDGYRAFRYYFDSVKSPVWQDWLHVRDLLPYESDLHPWLDGFCRIRIPANLTRDGIDAEFVFSPDLLEVIPDVPESQFKTQQELIDHVYRTAGTAD